MKAEYYRFLYYIIFVGEIKNVFYTPIRAHTCIYMLY